MKERNTPPTTTCRLCIVRHGETAWNAAGRLQGHVDIPLNAAGEAQAAALARRLASLGEEFSALYCSDLLRTRQTAAALLDDGLQAVYDARLRERHYGIFQGLTHDEGARLDAAAHARFRAREAAFELPGAGESLLRFAARVHAAFDDIVRRHPGESVLVITHGGVLDLLHRRAHATPLEPAREVGIPNAALNWLQAAAGQWQVLHWADAGHLDAARDEISDR